MKHINLEKLMQAQFDLAKFWIALATCCGIAILLIDILVIFLSPLSILFALLAAILVVLNTIFIWRSDRIRENAETTLRKFEMCRSLGWEISMREIANMLAAAPNSVKKAARSTEEYNYFSSTSDFGAKKLLENLEESSWLTKHQARQMSKYVAAFGITMMSLSFISLIVTIQSMLPATISQSVAKIIVSLIVFMFSGGYIRLAFDYDLLANQASKAEENAFRLRSEEKISEIEAIKLLHDYQIDRANSPLLPTWLWKIMSKELNELWNERLRLEND
jgi:hypothetical protein